MGRKLKYGEKTTFYTKRVPVSVKEKVKKRADPFIEGVIEEELGKKENKAEGLKVQAQQLKKMHVFKEFSSFSGEIENIKMDDKVEHKEEGDKKKELRLFLEDLSKLEGE